jgi:hypothetical protein
MRERIATLVGVLALVLLAGLSVLFARAQNPGAPGDAAAGVTTTPAPSAGPTADPSVAMAQAADSARGRVVYQAQGCEGCHSIAGVGSPRSPLDGVGARRTAAELRAWTLGLPAVADSLPPAMLRLKQGFAEIPAEELDALMVFLGSLRGG